MLLLCDKERCEEYRDGELVRTWFEEVPNEVPTVDPVALADQLAAVSEAVDYLILNSLGDCCSTPSARRSRWQDRRTPARVSGGPVAPSKPGRALRWRTSWS